jgi:hypothetical protein
MQMPSVVLPFPVASDRPEEWPLHIITMSGEIETGFSDT